MIRLWFQRKPDPFQVLSECLTVAGFFVEYESGTREVERRWIWEDDKPIAYIDILPQLLTVVYWTEERAYPDIQAILDSTKELREKRLPVSFSAQSKLYETIITAKRAVRAATHY